MPVPAGNLPDPAASTAAVVGSSIETVTVIRPPGKDRFGDRAAGEDVEHDEQGCQFAPGPSKEAGFAANTVDTDATIYGPAGMDILATDLVRVRGDIYSVVGKPELWGGEGVVVAVRLVTG